MKGVEVAYIIVNKINGLTKKGRTWVNSLKLSPITLKTTRPFQHPWMPGEKTNAKKTPSGRIGELTTLFSLVERLKGQNISIGEFSELLGLKYSPKPKEREIAEPDRKIIDEGLPPWAGFQCHTRHELSP